MFNKNWIYGVYSLLVCVNVSADTCPSLDNTSLAWGRVPPPWVVSPGSQDPQPDDMATFKEATILVAGFSVGVSCTYQFSEGTYTIYYQTRVSKPSMNDTNWYEKPGGYGCAMGIEECVFHPQIKAAQP